MRHRHRLNLRFVGCSSEEVRLNFVNSGLTLAKLAQQGVTIEEAINRATKSLPPKHFDRPEEIAHAVVHRASAGASYATGALLAMDGAFTPTVE